MHLFYTPDIHSEEAVLPEEEARHCVRVMRLKVGDEVMLTDGQGSFYDATLTIVSPKQCVASIRERLPQLPQWRGNLHIAVAPTKNFDRMEWLAEKLTEIGIDALTFLLCRHSERKTVNDGRIEKLVVAAMKQSLKARLPELHTLTSFETFVTQPFTGLKLIAHCNDADDKLRLAEVIRPEGIPTRILIGPEGDFAPEEVALALTNGYTPITLGETRLRTETAALTAGIAYHILTRP
ncbi:MAG: 16S rRNA (uracil(1498)-N(3))-methyltransferase [Prevotellaceae bacterium]|jgi:16S rRNA (uracil1498-N3)-methyltransferase|nr:16S rRNA (uracil(1498)-N(3))-methyltransferase [Prevotellaceae bacterium]